MLQILGNGLSKTAETVKDYGPQIVSVVASIIALF